MHVSSSKRGRQKGLNFELNLVPFIDVLSVCICFLLLTAVFINLGSIHVSQAVGSESAATKSKASGTVTVSLGSGGQVRIETKDVPGQRPATVTLNGVGGQVDFKRTNDWIRSFAAQHADVKTVLLMPNPTSKYDDLIQLMAQFKQSAMDQIGLAPL